MLTNKLAIFLLQLQLIKLPKITRLWPFKKGSRHLSRCVPVTISRKVTALSPD